MLLKHLLTVYRHSHSFLVSTVVRQEAPMTGKWFFLGKEIVILNEVTSQRGKKVFFAVMASTVVHFLK